MPEQFAVVLAVTGGSHGIIHEGPMSKDCQDAWDTWWEDLLDVPSLAGVYACLVQWEDCKAGEYDGDFRVLEAYDATLMARAVDVLRYRLEAVPASRLWLQATGTGEEQA